MPLHLSEPKLPKNATEHRLNWDLYLTLQMVSGSVRMFILLLIVNASN